MASSTNNNEGRTCFISCSQLARGYNLVPKAEMDNALFLFGSKRSWVFPETPEEIEDAGCQPGNYNNMNKKFKELIKKKDEQGLVFFLKPDDLVYSIAQDNGDPTAYHRASEWLKTVVDPTTGQNYPGLNLDLDYWKNEFAGGKYLHQVGGKFVADLIEQGSHGYSSIMQLIATSCPTIKPRRT